MDTAVFAETFVSSPTRLYDITTQNVTI